MLNVKEMTFEEFIAKAEAETGQKCDDAIKGLIKIVFDNLKNDYWGEEDLRDIVNAIKETRAQRRKDVINA